MPPNTETVSKLDHFKVYFKQVANPYSDNERKPIDDNPVEDVVNGGNGQDEISDEVPETPNRVTTRAKQTYELYRYTKNAMLILSTPFDSDFCSRVIGDLERTFEEFRFEVEVHLVSNSRGIYEKCQQFFERDFTHYGAVALAIVTSMGVNPAEHCRYGYIFFEETIIVENFKLERNATLANKPKIYISEANRRIMGRSWHNTYKMDPIVHGDVIGFHVPFLVPENLKKSNMLAAYERFEYFKYFDNREFGAFCPLRILCNKMTAMAHEHAVPKIIEETIRDASESLPLLKHNSIDTVNTLSRELYLERMEPVESMHRRTSSEI